MCKRNFLSGVALRYWRQPIRNLRWKFKRAVHYILARVKLNRIPDSTNEFVSEGVVASVLLPSRGRASALRRTLKNIAKTSGGGVEVLVRLDDDDDECLEAQESFHVACAPLPLNIIIGPRGKGYGNLHNFMNDLAAAARGDFLILFNDDAVFDSNEWGIHLLKWRNRLAVLKFKIILNEREIAGNIFPAIHRKIFQILGHISLQNHYDAWIEEIAKTAGCRHCESSVRTIHMHGENEDSTFLDARGVDVRTIPEFSSRENARLLQKDMLSICAHIIRYGETLHVVGKDRNMAPE